jgi:hypothetical protein
MMKPIAVILDEETLLKLRSIVSDRAAVGDIDSDGNRRLFRLYQQVMRAPERLPLDIAPFDPFHRTTLSGRLQDAVMRLTELATGEGDDPVMKAVQLAMLDGIFAEIQQQLQHIEGQLRLINNLPESIVRLEDYRRNRARKESRDEA